MIEETGAGETKPKRRLSPAIAILLVVAALFAGILFAKARSAASSASVQAPAGAVASPPAAATITSVHNDAVADYQAALKTGKPIYVLFHSLS